MKNRGPSLSSRRGTIFHPTLGYAIPPPLPPTVARRNARERSRVKSVNQSYEHLRVHVPAASRAKKISKVDIIKHSIEYIQKLRALVESCDQREWESYGQLAYPLKAEPYSLKAEPCSMKDESYPSFHTSSNLPSNLPPYPPPSPTSPTSMVSQESGYGSPQNHHFQFPPSYSSSCSSSQTSQLPYPPHEDGCSLKPKEDDMILDVILDWQKS